MTVHEDGSFKDGMSPSDTSSSSRIFSPIGSVIFPKCTCEEESSKEILGTRHTIIFLFELEQFRDFVEIRMPSTGD